MVCTICVMPEPVLFTGLVNHWPLVVALAVNLLCTPQTLLRDYLPFGMLRECVVMSYGWLLVYGSRPAVLSSFSRGGWKLGYIYIC